MTTTSVLMLRDVENLLEKYPPYTINIPRKLSFDLEEFETELSSEGPKSAIRSYFDILSDLVKQNKYYSQDKVSVIRTWLSKICDLLDALENVIKICEDTQDPFENERMWSLHLAILSIIKIIEKLKDEVRFLRVYATNNPKLVRRTREKTLAILASRVGALLSILITAVSVETEEAPPSEIVSVIGKECQI